MKIDHNDIFIPRNYCLVKPDPDFNKFHLNGEEFLETGKVDLENVAEHYSIRGRVYAVPDELVFNLAQIRANKIPVAPLLDFEQTMFYFKSNYMETEGYKKGSVQYDVPMEVRTGDMVYFNYQEHYNCYDHGRYVDTVEHGEMLLIKYDELILCHPYSNENAITMLNGIVLLEPIGVETMFGQNIIKKSGLDIVKHTGNEKDFQKKLNIGYVRYFGEHVRDFINEPDKRESAYDFAKEQVVMYNPRVAPPLEFSLHKTSFEGKHLVKLRRRDIFAILPVDITDGLVEDMVTSINLN